MPVKITREQTQTRNTDMERKIEDWKLDKYGPVEGCEECEFAETSCYECFAYGESQLVEEDDG